MPKTKLNISTQKIAYITMNMRFWSSNETTRFHYSTWIMVCVYFITLLNLSVIKIRKY